MVKHPKHGCAESFSELVRQYQVPVIHFFRQGGCQLSRYEGSDARIFLACLSLLSRDLEPGHCLEHEEQRRGLWDLAVAETETTVTETGTSIT